MRAEVDVVPYGERGHSQRIKGGQRLRGDQGLVRCQLLFDRCDEPVGLRVNELRSMI